MDLLLSLPAVRASPPVLQCNHRNIILNKILLLLRQCMVQLARPVASLKLLVLPLQQSGHRGLNPDALGKFYPQRHPSTCWFCHPARKTRCKPSGRDSSMAAVCGLLGPWQTLRNPWQLTPAVAGVFIAKAVSWRFQWFQLLPSTLGRTKPLWGWQGGHAGDLVPAHWGSPLLLNGAGNRLMFQDMTKAVEQVKMQSHIKAFSWGAIIHSSHSSKWELSTGRASEKAPKALVWASGGQNTFRNLALRRSEP